MAVAINGADNNPITIRDVEASGNNFVTTINRLVFSGNYTTGGDTLNLTALASLVPSGSLPVQASITANGTGTQQSAAGGYYTILAGTTLANWLIKIFSSGGAELGAGAYAAAQTGDVVFLNLTWRKMVL